MFMSKKLKILTLFIPLALPFVAFAQKKDLNYLIGLAADYLNKALLLLMGFAVLMFVWYIIQFFLRPTDKRSEGAKYLMWSVIGFFVILSMWGIVNILISTFNLESSPSSWSQYFDIFPKQ
jgi:hypothetical protein